jgi:hypothetical protein
VELMLPVALAIADLELVGPLRLVNLMFFRLTLE